MARGPECHAEQIPFRAASTISMWAWQEGGRIPTFSLDRLGLTDTSSRKPPGLVLTLDSHSMSPIVLKVDVLVTQLCLTLCDPLDCSPPAASVHGILQARILEWVAISFSRGSSRPRD